MKELYRLALCASLTFMPVFANDALAAESGSGAYILGIRGPGAGVTPPPGVFVSNQVFTYSGDIERSIPFGDFEVLARGRADAIVNILTLQWVTPAEIAGGRLGFTLTVPAGTVEVEGSALGFTVNDDTTTFGDPSVGAFLGWRHANFHLQAGITAFLPIGGYDSTGFANVAKNRTAFDFFGALSWVDPGLGLDFTNIVGITYNLENEASNYKTGTEFHWEWALTKKFSNGLSFGPAGYYYQQLTDDSGRGAILGSFRGETVAVGGTLGYEFMIGRLPVSTRLKYYHEFESKNRLEGDAAFVTLSMPLWVQQ